MTSAVIRLDGTATEGRDVLGGKAFDLNRMAALGLPVPPAFVIPTTTHARYRSDGRIPDDVWAAVRSEIDVLSEQLGHRFGHGPVPLLVSVRSGAAVSMPGMMDTILNLGLTPALRDALGEATGSPEWAEDSWRRFVDGWSDTVDATAGPPDDVYQQLSMAIGAVFESWDSPRARAYRESKGIDHDGGTAVTVQSMVFGNRDEHSGTGVAFTRDPGTGEPGVTGDWLARAQGEDVVSGSATPDDLGELAARHPELHRQLLDAVTRLEDDAADMMDIEFTVESGTLYLLQSRVGTRSPRAAVRIAADLEAEGRIDRAEAAARVTPEQLALAAGSATVRPGAVPLVTGLSVCDGVVVGTAVTEPDDAIDRGAAGEAVVLVRTETSPADVPAMFSSVAVVTARGGATSHAAVVCREVGLPCVVGAGDDVVDALAGRTVTVDGGAGAVYDGDVLLAGDDGDSDSVEQLRTWRRVAGDDDPAASGDET